MKRRGSRRRIMRRRRPHLAKISRSRVSSDTGPTWRGGGGEGKEEKRKKGEDGEKWEEGWKGRKG